MIPWMGITDANNARWVWYRTVTGHDDDEEMVDDEKFSHRCRMMSRMFHWSDVRHLIVLFLYAMAKNLDSYDSFVFFSVRYSLVDSISREWFQLFFFCINYNEINDYLVLSGKARSCSGLDLISRRASKRISLPCSARSSESVNHLGNMPGRIFLIKKKKKNSTAEAFRTS